MPSAWTPDLHDMIRLASLKPKPARRRSPRTRITGLSSDSMVSLSTLLWCTAGFSSRACPLRIPLKFQNEVLLPGSMSKSSDLEAVVISADPAIVEPVSQSLIRAEIRPAIFRETRTAIECLFRRKVDAIVIDLHVDRALPLLKELPNTPSNSRIPAFAVASSGFRDAFGLAHFTFEAPIHQPAFVQALRKAYPVMLRERYHYCRHAVELPVTITRGSGNTLEGVSVNISEGGMALQCDLPLQKHDRLQLEFNLPQKLGTVKCRGEVVWSDARQLIGLKFLALKPTLQKLLSFWLADQW